MSKLQTNQMICLLKVREHGDLGVTAVVWRDTKGSGDGQCSTYFYWSDSLMVVFTLGTLMDLYTYKLCTFI